MPFAHAWLCDHEWCRWLARGSSNWSTHNALLGDIYFFSFYALIAPTSFSIFSSSPVFSLATTSSPAKVRT